MSEYDEADRTLLEEAHNMSRGELLEMVNEVRVAGHEDVGTACPVCRVGELVEPTSDPSGSAVWSCKCQEILEDVRDERSRKTHIRAEIEDPTEDRPICRGRHDFLRSDLLLTDRLDQGNDLPEEYPPRRSEINVYVCRRCGLLKVETSDLDLGPN